MSQVDLPIGKWQISGNEEQGGLDISSVDSQGNLTGSAFGDKISGIHWSPIYCSNKCRQYPIFVSWILRNISRSSN